MNERGPRAETGPMRFGQDWRGVWIRGDTAFNCVQQIMPLVPKLENEWASPTDQVALRTLRGLLSLLQESNELDGTDAETDTQQLKDFKDCLR